MAILRHSCQLLDLIQWVLTASTREGNELMQKIKTHQWWLVFQSLSFRCQQVSNSIYNTEPISLCLHYGVPLPGASIKALISLEKEKQPRGSMIVTGPTEFITWGIKRQVYWCKLWISCSNVTLSWQSCLHQWNRHWNFVAEGWSRLVSIPEAQELECTGCVCSPK